MMPPSIPELGKIINRSALRDRVVQFGTGMLLRALPDWLIDRANDDKESGAGIVMVKSTSPQKGPLDDQNGFYTVIERGLHAGKPIDRPRIIRCVTRVLAAETEWESILACARNPEIDLIISNTTEAGLVYQPEMISRDTPPKSFPAKLTRYLLERFEAFHGDPLMGMVVLPTELLVDNGKLLLDYVLRHATANGYPDSFLDWVRLHNRFCSTLVDRIVPGRCEPDDVVTCEGITFIDRAHTAAEPYLLWAIEGDEEVRRRLWFAGSDSRVIVTHELSPYREQKLRILNGSNTMVAAVGWLAGCRTTFDTMTDPLVSRYVESLIAEEILPTIRGTCPDAESFAAETLDRFRNEAIRYPLLTIARQYTAKMNSRNVETVFRYAESGRLPFRCIIGLAAYMVFHEAKQEDGNWYGSRNGERYPYIDDHAQSVCAVCSGMGAERHSVRQAVLKLFGDATLFSRNLTTIPGLADAVTDSIIAIREKGMAEVLRNADF